ncbi:TadE/TadG family type IV pilus assembly protein [Promicromonospora sp. CA-289599]|uniref:TadE/TadG family type IV pilus assembly protein n=1 Tax=Promicromonospora sp. CA-289599 TaxID=3240014 RepID=UPI003D8F250D
MSRGRGADESGQATVELVGVVFAIVLVALLAIQGITVAQAASITQEAARNGARALSQGQNWRAVVERQVPDGLVLRSAEPDLDGNTASVSVTVSAPLGLAGMDITDVSVTRTADFPVEQRRRTGD